MLLSTMERLVQSFRADVNLQAIQEPVQDDLDAAQAMVRDFFASPIAILRGIADHLLAVAGKRYRPTILLLVSRLGSPDPGKALFGAAMIELIHTATLVHDDTIDRSNVRRGRPTINTLFDDKVSIITGDYICTKVFHEMLERGLYDLVRIAASCAYRMSMGEMLQLEQKNDLGVTEESYMILVNEKTASLMGASSEMGAILGGFDPRDAERFRSFGESLGRAYQITDDLFDYVGSEGEMGKGVRTDLAEGKITLPLIRALGVSSGATLERLKELAGNRNLSITDWEDLHTILEETRAIEYCRTTAMRHAEQALVHLGSGPTCPFRRGLERAVVYAVQRSH